ncbi:hypothetical protein B484DRAFT_444067 [Ochromonadaceae sp. CCMP2298]|nr:hypothetical protein B484DRAFT_444067 [Ochromonadaceae sp. CCMP2298]
MGDLVGDYKENIGGNKGSQSRNVADLEGSMQQVSIRKENNSRSYGKARPYNNNNNNNSNNNHSNHNTYANNQTNNYNSNSQRQHQPPNSSNYSAPLKSNRARVGAKVNYNSNTAQYHNVNNQRANDRRPPAPSMRAYEHPQDHTHMQRPQRELSTFEFALTPRDMETCRSTAIELNCTRQSIVPDPALMAHLSMLAFTADEFLRQQQRQEMVRWLSSRTEEERIAYFARNQPSLHAQPIRQQMMPRPPVPQERT